MSEFLPVPAKLLLFGEHSILFGSPAITLPLDDYSARLIMPENKTDNESNRKIKKFAEYLNQNEFFKPHLNLQKLNGDIDNGLYLQSNIPQGCGLGSSASLCVAIYNSYGTSKLNNPLDLKDFFSHMESFFHGKSSGIDPLTIYTGKQLLVKNSRVVILPEQTFPPDIHVYLLDSGINRNSAQMINSFKALMDDSAYKNDFQARYIPLLERLIHQFTTQSAEIWSSLQLLSRLQSEFFRIMIPNPIFKLWKNALEANDTCFKILGAGGGGFFLVFSKKKPENAGFAVKELKLVVRR